LEKRCDEKEQIKRARKLPQPRKEMTPEPACIEQQKSSTNRVKGSFLF
jgi:hypothetical protein